mgnify:CR=1 FL=1|jgi:hypothetical protein
MAAKAAGLAIEVFKNSKTKERGDMILEPLQVMITLGMLGFCPIGTKVNISQNTLYIHEPSIFQGAMRWFEGDSKDDLYYLFHAIRRYYKWYMNRDNEQYDYILSLAKNGIKNLIQTYKNADKQSILHTLSLYHNILELNTPELFESDSDGDTVTIDQVFSKITALYDERIITIVFNIFKTLVAPPDNEYTVSYIAGLREIMKPTENSLRTWIQTNLTL